MTRESHRILVVDDDRIVRLILHETLDRMGAGYQVETASDGQDALTKLDRDSYDLMITDLKLPEMGGVELTRVVRSRQMMLSVIWISAYIDGKVEEEAMRLHVFRFLHKPLGIAQIRAAAQAALSAHNGQAQQEVRSEQDGIGEQAHRCVGGE
jgi:DNA-binding NtrC family response regulator